MSDDINIPPEALEEMLRSFGCECSSREKAMKRVGLAMLKAWPGMGKHPYTKCVILPLTENTND